MINKKSVKNLIILGNNASGLKGKFDSFNSLIKLLSPGVTMVQETKLYRKGTYKLENYCIFEKIRGENEGGGLMTIVHENLEPVLIPTKNSSKMSLNVLVVEALVLKIKIRFINSYGIQENCSAEDRSDYYNILEEEILQTFDCGRMLCIETDANAKLGPRYIQGDLHQMSANGKLLMSLIERHNLVVINGTDKCTGVITRMRKKGGLVEKSTIDFFIVCQSLFQMVTKMTVDEKRSYVLTKFTRNQGKVESDHNPMILELNMSWNTKVRQQRVEIYNLKNKECQKKFLEYTNKSDLLTKSLIQKDIRVGGRMWIKSLKYIIMQTFRKVRLNYKDKSSLQIESLIGKSYGLSDVEKTKINEEISCLTYERNRKIIVDQIG